LRKLTSSLILATDKTLEAYTLEPGMGKTQNVDCSKPGYKLLGIRGYYTGSNQCYFYTLATGSGEKIIYQIKNATTSTATGTPIIQLLYIKNGL
jgi:hypothetical protein